MPAKTSQALEDENTELIAGLRSAGLLRGSQVRLTPLTGGVSSEIFLVESGSQRFVVKRALARLRVKDAWFADVGRNRTEQEFFAYAAGVVPENVPHILHREPEEGWFAMEYLGDPLRNWKTELMAGRGDGDAARLAGATLGCLHAASWNDLVARERFATQGNFTTLRINPYFLTAARRVPAAREFLQAEASKLAEARLALVHGDFSPKNLLIAANRLVILDAEVAWFGDPAFDLAFLLTHLHLKELWRRSSAAVAPQVGGITAAKSVLPLVTEVWAAYAVVLESRADANLEARTIRLILCLMLARVHGKSPVEYLTTTAQQEFVTRFVTRHHDRAPTTVGAHVHLWDQELGLQFA